MPFICYKDKKFNAVQLGIIEQANVIIAEYAAAGYDLTLRQLYYQFISKDLFPETWKDSVTGSTNNEKSYTKLGNIISDGRRAGKIDWDRIVDRTRFLRTFAGWESPRDIVGACAKQYDVDWWEAQPYYVEVWIEKDALVGILKVACDPYRVPYLACRGYASDSELWAAGQRFLAAMRRGKKTRVIHLGDHDPSGIDMTRDIDDRLKMYTQGTNVEVVRLALTYDQVQQYTPPPNPAKTTDARFDVYSALYGDESWELDALEPSVITSLIHDNLEEIIDQEEWSYSAQLRDNGRERLQAVVEELRQEEENQ